MAKLISKVFRRRTKQRDASIAESEAPWQDCLAVCYKCARKVRAMDGDKTKLRIALKALIGLKGLKSVVRPVDISCLDVCPEKKITVARFRDGKAEIINVGPHVDPAEILKRFGY